MEELHIHLHFGPQFYKALERLAVPHGLTADIKQIKGDIKKIMSAQDDFDAKITAANEKLDAIGTNLTNVQTAIDAEKQQIADFIAAQPSGVDTSALDGVVTRLGGISDSLATEATNVGGIFEPPTA